jgi:hypothetical protein
VLNHKQIAEVYRMGLVIGLFEVKSVVAWADGVIGAEADPDYALIEVSMAGDANEGKMAALLKEVKGDADPKHSQSVVLGLLARKLAADPGRGAAIAAQVKALETSEGMTAGIGADLGASLSRHESAAKEWPFG